ncbi:MAG: PAS domain S-box-containing protein [Vicingaceae bacterium]|jgi:PAS domain S-box-containing protein
MKLENKNNRTTIFTLASTLLLSIAFIVSSVFLIQKINSAQNTIQQNNNCLHYAVNIQKNASNAIKTLSKEKAVSEQLIEESLTLSSQYEELKQLNEIFIGIKRVSHKEISFIEATLLQQELFAVEGLCYEIIEQNRASSRINSTELHKYWTYTHVILIIACILMIILAITSLYVGKTKKQLLEERSKNKFILNNSVNVFSSSDIHGNILEFNPAAQESFGYTLEEARALDYKMMYHSEKDLIKVAKALKENRIFTGEVTNRRKDGSLFISYLEPWESLET